MVWYVSLVPQKQVCDFFNGFGEGIQGVICLTSGGWWPRTMSIVDEAMQRPAWRCHAHVARPSPCCPLCAKKG